MNKNLKMVEDFHLNFQNPVYKNATEVSYERRILGLKLLLEELTELAEALGVKKGYYKLLENTTENLFSLGETFENTGVTNEGEVVDALADIEYILDGRIIEFGYSNIYDTAFLAVHQSNMTKLCKDEAEAAETVVNYDKQGIKTYFESNNKGKFIVKRKSDNKIMKNINYTPFKASEIFK